MHIITCYIYTHLLLYCFTGYCSKNRHFAAKFQKRSQGEISNDVAKHVHHVTLICPAIHFDHGSFRFENKHENEILIYIYLVTQ